MKAKLPKTLALIAVITFVLFILLSISPLVDRNLVKYLIVVSMGSSVAGILLSSYSYYKTKDDIDTGLLVSLFSNILVAIAIAAIFITSIGV